jgi:4a-hydroxytetrahydrobiopterin dehydratase
MWTQENDSLYRKFQFKDFKEAFAFLTKVALISEQLNHHPTIKNTWNTVELWLNTHEAGNTLTAKDRELAKKIDEVA